MTMRTWGFAAGLAAALAFVGQARAQSGSSNQMGGTAEQGTPSGGTTDTRSPGERSGWSGNEANRTGSSATTRDSTAGSTGSATPSAQAGERKVDKGLEKKLQKIHAANQAEVQLAELGSRQAQSPEVKQYAEMLQRDHTDMDQQLTQAAQTSGLQLTGKEFEEQQKDAAKNMEKLQKKTGQDFDKEFMSHMVKDHEKDLKEVKSAAKDAHKANQTELAQVLDKATSGIEGHRDQAERIRDALKSQKGQARTGAATGSTGSAADTGGAPVSPSEDRSTGSSGAEAAPAGTPSHVGSGKDPGDTGTSGGKTQGQNPPGK